VDEVKTVAEFVDRPVDMLLYCPVCGHQHVDQPQPEKNWTNPPHRSHECQYCSYVWRPADVPTNGVEALQTQGKLDGSAALQTQGRLHDHGCVVGSFGSSVMLRDGSKVCLERGESAHAAHVWLGVKPAEKVLLQKLREGVDESA